MAITKFDDFLVHQLETTFDHVIDSDPRWHERYWFNIHQPELGIVIGHGLGVYPNSGLMDGFASLLYQGTQYNVRAARGLNHERWDTKVGPIGVKVIQGLRSTNIVLDENEQGIAYDLTLQTATAPFSQVPMPFIRVDGRVHQHSAMFSQCGRVSGWVKIAGRTFRADPESWWHAKSNGWGIRSKVGGPAAATRPARDASGLAAWTPDSVFISAQFAERYICVADNSGAILHRPTDARGEIAIEARHDIKFLQGTIRPERLETTIKDAKGRELHLTAEPLATLYLNDGSWGAYKDYFDGLYRGEEHYGEAFVESRRLDVADPAIPAQSAGRDDHVCEFRLEDEIGYGVLELGVRGDEPYAPFTAETALVRSA